MQKSTRNLTNNFLEHKQFACIELKKVSVFLSSFFESPYFIPLLACVYVCVLCVNACVRRHVFCAVQASNVVCVVCAILCVFCVYFCYLWVQTVPPAPMDMIRVTDSYLEERK